MSKIYSLNPIEVKRVLTQVAQKQKYDNEQFEFYHHFRNHFNVKNEVKQLKKVSGNKFIDNFGNFWEEVSTLKNYFHMPKGNWITSAIGFETPYSRKFLRDDTISGLDGEFEMIIRQGGKRIDALTHEEYQETYNYGKTRDWLSHKKLDIDPHNLSSKYTFRMDMGYVKVLE